MKTREELKQHIDAMLAEDWRELDKLWDYFRGGELAKAPNHTVDKYWFNYFLNHAEQGNSWAMIAIGNFYEWGIGTKKDDKLAVEYYQQAANLNNPRGITIIGNCYNNGYGFEKNIHYARKFYQKAAELDYPEAYYSLAILEKESNLKEYRRLLLLAAGHNYPQALKELYLPAWNLGNPFKLYKPNNKDLEISITNNSITKIISGTSHTELESYTITIQYNGPINIGDRTILTRKINHIPKPSEALQRRARREAEYSTSNIIAMLVSLATCTWPCVLCLAYPDNACCDPCDAILKEQGDINTYAWDLARDAYIPQCEKIFAGYIQEADEILSKRLGQISQEQEQKPSEYKSYEPNQGRTDTQSIQSQLIQAQNQLLQLQSQLLQAQQQNAPLPSAPPEYNSPPPYNVNVSQNLFKPAKTGPQQIEVQPLNKSFQPSAPNR